MPEVIHVFSEQDSKASLLAEVHRLQSSLAAMRQARDFHGANSAYLMQERDRLQKEIEMSKLERWTVAPGGLTQHPLGECVLTVDHLAEVQRLRELVADADHLCKWLLQSDISDDDRECVTRENGINFAAALQAGPRP